jgi:hypothetical protein
MLGHLRALLLYFTCLLRWLHTQPGNGTFKGYLSAMLGHLRALLIFYMSPPLAAYSTWLSPRTFPSSWAAEAPVSVCVVVLVLGVLVPGWDAN